MMLAEQWRHALLHMIPLAKCGWPAGFSGFQVLRKKECLRFCAMVRFHNTAVLAEEQPEQPHEPLMRMAMTPWKSVRR